MQRVTCQSVSVGVFLQRARSSGISSVDELNAMRPFDLVADIRLGQGLRNALYQPSGRVEPLALRNVAVERKLLI